MLIQVLFPNLLQLQITIKIMQFRRFFLPLQLVNSMFLTKQLENLTFTQTWPGLPELFLT